MSHLLFNNTCYRMINKAIRELEKEIKNLERSAKRLEGDIKKAGRENQIVRLVILYFIIF